MQGNITIVDYGTCNVLSVQKVLLQQGYNARISSDAQEIAGADKLILPGIGHFAHAMTNLQALGLIDVLHELVLERQRPILGICLGMQLMAEQSREGAGHAGLGWIKGQVLPLEVTDPIRYKVPHIGWNAVEIRKSSRLMHQIDGQQEFYFTHSFHFLPTAPAAILNTTRYGHVFVSAVEQNNIFGVQYHPEKSHGSGFQLLKNFAAL